MFRHRRAADSLVRLFISSGRSPPPPCFLAFYVPPFVFFHRIQKQPAMPCSPHQSVTVFPHPPIPPLPFVSLFAFCSLLPFLEVSRHLKRSAPRFPRSFAFSFFSFRQQPHDLSCPDPTKCWWGGSRRAADPRHPLHDPLVFSCAYQSRRTSPLPPPHISRLTPLHPFFEHASPLSPWHFLKAPFCPVHRHSMTPLTSPKSPSFPQIVPTFLPPPHGILNLGRARS